MSDSTPSEIEVRTDTPGSEVKLPEGYRNSLDNSIYADIPWIIDGLISEGEQMLIFGPPKVGKSQFALQMGVAVARGMPFLNRAIICEKGKEFRKVLYVNLEIGECQFMRRLAYHVRICETHANGEINGDEANTDEAGKVMGISSGLEPAMNGLDEIGKLTNIELTYTAEPQVVTETNSEFKLSQDALDATNKKIKDRFFFNKERRSIGILKDHIVKPQNTDHGKVKKTAVPKRSGKRPEKPKEKPTEEPNEKQEQLLEEWYGVFDALEPDLIIFDTLSKMHEIDERDNNLIQGVIMLIRKMAKGRPGADGVRKNLAHVIVHHARKSSDDGRPLRFLSLDAIRGGSAIRAEADVIIAINGSEHPKENNKVRRMVGIEARNIAGDEFHTEFDGYVFNLAEPESATDAWILNRFKEAKENKNGIPGVRGIPIGVLAALHSKNKNKRSAEYLRSRELLSEYAETSVNLEYILKKGNETLIANFPVHGRKSNGQGYFWIRDGSAWLEDDTIKTAIAAMPGNNAATSKAGAKKAAKKVPKTGAKKAARKAPKAGAKKAAKKVPKTGAKKAAKKAPKADAKKAAKKVPKTGTKQATKKVPRNAAKKVAKKTAKKEAEKVAQNAVRKRG